MQLSSVSINNSSASDSFFQSELLTNHTIQILDWIWFPRNFRNSSIHIYLKNQPRLCQILQYNWYGSTVTVDCGSSGFGKRRGSWGFDNLGNPWIKNSNFRFRCENSIRLRKRKSTIEFFIMSMMFIYLFLFLFVLMLQSSFLSIKVKGYKVKMYDF